MNFLAEDAFLTQDTFEIIDLDGDVVSTGTWGIWSGDYSVSDSFGELDETSAFHFAVGSQATTDAQLASLAGNTLSYQQIGAISTNEVGAVGEYLATYTGTFAADPTLGTITLTISPIVDFAAGSNSWNLTGAGTVADLIGPDGVFLSGTCSVCAGPAGIGAGMFLGPNAEGVITSVGASDGVNSFVSTHVAEEN